MEDFNLDVIKEKTYTKIGCSNFIKEDIKRTKKKKVLINTLITILFLSAGLFTVNAATNNGLVNMIKQIAKMNDRNYEVIIHEVPVKITEETEDGEITISTHNRCIRIPKTINNNYDSYDEICYPAGTKFEDIELYYDKNSHNTGYHITGTDENGEYFEDNWNIKDDEEIEKRWNEDNK